MARQSSCKNVLFVPYVCHSDSKEPSFAFQYMGDDDEGNCQNDVKCPVVMSREFAERHWYCSPGDYGQLSNGMDDLGPYVWVLDMVPYLVYFLLAADALQDLLRKVIRRGSNEKYAFLMDPFHEKEEHEHGAGCLRAALAVNTIVFGLQIEYLLRFCPLEEERHPDQFFVENAKMDIAWVLALMMMFAYPVLCLYFGIGVIGTGGALLSYICTACNRRRGGNGASDINRVLKFMIAVTFNMCCLFHFLLALPFLWNTLGRDGGNGIGKFLNNLARVPDGWEDLLGGFSFISIGARVASEVALVFLGWLLGEGLPSVFGRYLSDGGGKRNVATAGALELSGAVL